MHYIFSWLSIFSVFLSFHSFAQNDLQLIFPEGNNWTNMSEGETLQFTLEAQGGTGQRYNFQLNSPEDVGLTLSDSVITWMPALDLVRQEEGSKIIPVTFQVSTAAGETASRKIDFTINNTLRIPSLTDFQPFFIYPDSNNIFTIPIDSKLFTVEGDGNNLPDGLKVIPGDRSHWQLRWKPSRDQFSALRKEPSKIRLIVRDKEFDDQANVEISLLPASATAREKETPTQADLELLLPRTSYWNVVDEGKALSFKLAARGGADDAYRYRVLNAQELGLNYDSLGNVYWRPPYDFVDRLQDTRAAQVVFEVQNQSGETQRKAVDLLVNHINRPPEIGDMHNFYVSYGKDNTYSLASNNAITDSDGDPVVFKPIWAQMPQNMTMTAEGELSWTPSVSQYNRLQKEPLLLPFIVEDQPYEARAQGTVRIEVTQQDLPPEISMVPNKNHYRIKEDEALNLKFILSDPNGDEDIVDFDFVADNDIPRSALVKNEPTQWEFLWEPGYDLLVEPGDTTTYQITFYAIDQSNQRQERNIQVHVADAENLVEKDRLIYGQYRTGLLRTMNLIDQLKDRQKELQKEYKKARRGKKHRAITTASLGAITGLSPVVIIDDVQTQKYVSGIGGTTSMTIGSLEASNVIGKDASDIYENLSYINQKLIELQTQGNLFAGKYALANSRRSNGYGDDLRKLILLLSLDKVTKLELDPSWKNPRKASDKNIKETFSDYNPDPERSPYINE